MTNERIIGAAAFLERVAAAVAAGVTEAQVRDWAGPVFDLLCAKGVLQRAEDSDVVRCPECHQLHAGSREWDQERAAWRWYCPEEGWVYPAEGAWRRWALDWRALAEALAAPLKRERSEPRQLGHSDVWLLGHAPLGVASRPLMLAPAVVTAIDYQTLDDILRRHAPQVAGVVVVLDASPTAGQHPGGHRFVRFSHAMAVDPDALAFDLGRIARLAGFVSGPRGGSRRGRGAQRSLEILQRRAAVRETAPTLVEEASAIAAERAREGEACSPRTIENQIRKAYRRTRALNAPPEPRPTPPTN